MLNNSTNRRSSLRSTLLLALSLFALQAVATSANGQEVSLEFTTQPPSHGSEVRFLAQPSGTVSASSLGDASLVPSTRTEHGYVVEVDDASYRQDKNHRYVVDMYVILKPDDPNSSLYKFLVWEDQAGKFSDSWADTTVSVTSHGITDSTKMRLPLHCTDSDNLQIDLRKPIRVGMGSDSTRTLGIKNALSDLHVSIQSVNGVKVEDRNCPNCWLALTGNAAHSNLAQGADTTLEIKFQPKTMQILKQNFLPPTADAAPYQLAVSVISTAEKGGFGVSQEFYVPIQFTPAPRFLTLSIFIGVVVGLFMRALLTKKIDWLDLMFQFLLAIVVWFILVGTKAKASMFGYDLDPTSLIAAGIITLVVAGGTSVGGKIAGALRKDEK
jgi:hypothetical protein